MKTRLITAGLILSILAGVGVFFALLHFRPGLGRGPTLRNTAVLLKEVQNLSQWVTVKYVVEKVILLEDAKWFGENRVLLVAHGVVKAGVNLDRLTPADLRVEGRTVVLRLPRPEITDVYLDDHRTQVVERSTGLLRVFDKTLEQEARRQAVTDLRIAARHNGILKDAEERAQTQLTGFFRQTGYQVKFEKAE